MMSTSIRTTRSLGTCLAPVLLSGLAAAGSSEHIYRTANGEPPGKIEFHDNGRIKSITGEAICTSSTKVYDGWVKEVTALGLKIMEAAPGPASDPPEPDVVRYVDSEGKTLNILGVDVVLTRDRSLDPWTSRIAGNPRDVHFATYVSPQLGPNSDKVDLPLSMEFEVVFEFSDARDSIRWSDLDDDPYIVVTNFKDDAATGGTTPAVIRPSRFQTPLALESVRLGVPANPNVLRRGATSGPVIGQVWDPYVDPDAAFGSSHCLVVTDASTNSFVPGMGTLLCAGNTVFSQQVPAGTSFSIPLPYDPALLGLPLCSQSVSMGSDSPQLSNAIDIVLGAR